jgi:hypothetical protein
MSDGEFEGVGDCVALRVAVTEPEGDADEAT